MKQAELVTAELVQVQGQRESMWNSKMKQK
jgi:hypothetical protein